MKTTRFAKLLVSTVFLVLAISTLAIASSKSGSEKLYIVEFRGEPDEVQLEALRLRGMMIVDHYDSDKYWVRAETGTTAAAIPFIKKISNPEISDKITLPLAVSTAMTKPSDKVTATVLFFDGISYRQASSLISSMGGVVLDKQMLYGDRLTVELPAGSVAKTALSDSVRIIEAGPREKITLNMRSAKASNVVAARSNFGLYGSGVVGGIWDGGAVGNHPDLEGRIIRGEKSKVSDHATHVAGTIVGSGALRPSAEGMAPLASLVSFDFKGDVPSEMASAVRDYGISFSNNSWSYSNGWSYHYILKLWIWWGDFYFGHYSSESAAYDKLVYDDDLVILFAAGNDRGEKGPTDYSVKYLDITKARGDETPHPADGPYRSIDVTGSAKNVITVGAVKQNGRMSSFSSWGPTKDGRIKPEISTVGTQVLSTLPDGKYDSWSGTSMATPGVSGAVALLFEQYRNDIGRDPSAAEIRALLAVTAKDIGKKGPDYSCGFGLMDINSAAQLVADSTQSGIIIRDAVRKAKTHRSKSYSFEIAKGTKHLKVALAWIDPPAQPNAKKALVNDLNLRLRRDSGVEELPWILDPSKPKALATKGNNDVDNIELIEVHNPGGGKWTIEVNAERINKSNKQKFALVVFTDSGINGKVTEVKNTN